MNHWGRDEEEAMSILQDIVTFRPDCQDFSEVEWVFIINCKNQSKYMEH